MKHKIGKSPRTRRAPVEGVNTPPRAQNASQRQAARGNGVLLDGLPVDLPDLDSLFDESAELRTDDVQSAFGVRTVALVHREPAGAVRALDMRKVSAAADTIAAMPAPGEYVHVLVGQMFAGFDLLPAFLNLTRAKGYGRLYLTTLGFSRDNLAALGNMVRGGQVDARRTRILCGDFFRRADSGLWDIGKLQAKELGYGFRSFRNHTKLILGEIAGAAYVVESSANLRSCQNLELFTITQSPGLFEFHAKWIDDVWGKARE